MVYLVFYILFLVLKEERRRMRNWGIRVGERKKSGWRVEEELVVLGWRRLGRRLKMICWRIGVGVVGFFSVIERVVGCVIVGFCKVVFVKV